MQLRNYVAPLQNFETVIMKNLVLLTLCLSIAFSSFSQTTPAKGNAKIIGSVADAETNQPVEFATIALIDPATNKPIDGAICDEKGQFSINKIAAGTYTVSISFIGYETQNIESITVQDKKDELSLGVIKLSTGAKILNEVVVEAQKQLIEERVDRTIYNAENDQTARGGDATDVLKRVPMLSVDLDGNVSMRGSSNVTVLINNKPSTIMASSIADALKQIPADQIKSVEVITSPSAKYDAEGSAGIINIITKKNSLAGFTLSVDAGVGLRASNLGLNGNYRKGKMGFSLGGFGRASYNVKGGFESNQQTKASFDENALFKTNFQSATTRNQGLFGNYTFGWDYDINDKNFVTASVRLGARNGTNYQDDLLTRINDQINPETSSLRNVVTKDLSNTIDVNLSYTHLYTKPQRELSILGSFSRNNRDNNFENIFQQENGVDVSKGFRNINGSFNEEMTFQADYQTPISTNQMLEFGGKDIVRKVFSEFSYLTDDDGDGIYIPSNNITLSNNLNYDQNVAAGYLSYTYSTKNNYSIKAGARYEYTTINAYTQTESDIDIPAYGALVPSVNISKKLNNGKTIKAAYNRRLQRPSIRFLNPNIQGSNPFDITKGNPELSQEYSNNYEVSYSTFIKGTSLNFSAFWRNTNNGIQDVRSVIGKVNTNPDTVLTTYQNIGQEDAIGMNIFGNVSLGKLSLNGGTDIYYTMMDNNLPIDPNNPEDPNRQASASNEGWVASGRMFGSYNLSKGWGFQFFGFYRGREVQLQGSRGGFGIYSLGLKKEFNNKKGSIGFGAENFFTTAYKIRSEVNSPLVIRSSVSEVRNMSFRINVSYRFGKMSVDSKPKRRRSINNDDLKEGGDGGGGGQGDGGQPQQRTGGGNSTTQGAARPAAAPTPKPIITDSAAVVEAVGIWNYTVESPQGGSGVLTIVKEGDKLSGKIKNNQFNKENDVASVTLIGNELSFSYEVSFGGNTMLVQVKAVVTGDTLSGNMAVGTFGTYPMQAQRSK